MAAYNIVKPVTRSTFIVAQGADNLPYVQLAAGLAIGALMHVYAGAIERMPRQRIIPVTQAGLAALLLAFWALFQTGATWVPVAFFVFGLILGLLLISQFWTLANNIFDARQARRLFGFIGGGASLGGAAGAGVTSLAVEAVGTTNLLPIGALVLLLSVAASAAVIRRHPGGDAPLPGIHHGVGAGAAVRLLRESRHLQIITLIIGFAAVGAMFIEQQLNMAAAAGHDSTDAITRFLADVTFYVSIAGFFIQVGLTGRIHRAFGLIVALLLLPVSLGATAVIILVNGAIWAPAAARVIDTSLRYTVDKTTREVLFLPLPADLTYLAKPFVDVTMDRFARAIGAVVLLVLIKPWGLGLDWQQISYASLAVMGGWIFFALAARREYLRAFRKSLDAHQLEPAAVRFDVADASTLETLVGELAKPDEESVVYAIDMLELLGRRDMVTPVLLHHDSARVRARTLAALATGPVTGSEPWLPTVRAMLRDPDADVRAAAVHAAASFHPDDADRLLRLALDDAEPRVVVAAAIDLAHSADPEGAAAAEAALARLAADCRPEAAGQRRDVAAALATIRRPGFHSLLIPLIHDPASDVARQAIASARAIGSSDALFVPALVSMLGHRELKAAAREALVSYGADIVALLVHVLEDDQEPIWVRRHIPSTLARLSTPASMAALVGTLHARDGFLRYKAIVAVETLRREHPELEVPRSVVEDRIVQETGKYYIYLTLRQNIVERDADRGDSLLARALADKLDRARDRLFRLLGLLLPWRDVAAARYAADGPDPRARANALEYLDNVLTGIVRRRVLPILDTTAIDEKVRHANSVLKTRPRDVADTVAQLVHDDDPVVAASALHFMASRRLAGPMRDDVEFVLSRRSADRLVADAAAWALQLTGEHPHAAGPATLPVVELADRLRAIPLFAFVSIDELFRVAEAARQVQVGPGALYREGDAAEEVFFLLDGRVRIARAGSPPADVAAPAALNVAEALEGRRLRHTLATDAVVSGLVLGTSELVTMLTDNIAAAQGLFRMLLGSPSAMDSDAGPGAGRADVAMAGTPHLDPIEKATRLRQIVLFSRATIDELKEISAAASEGALDRGQVLWDDGIEPAIYHVLCGEVTLEGPGDTRIVAGPGATIGWAEALTGTSPGRRAVVTQPGRALRLGRDELFEVLADHGDLLQGVFSACSARARPD
jgi:ATP/ADP translocase/CRP-like cAMP-binding protein